MKIRNLLAAGTVAAAAVLGTAIPALASVPAPAPAVTSTHVMFAVIDDTGVLVTTQHLTLGQEFYCGGIAHKVTLAASPEFRAIPSFPASAAGKVAVCTT